MGVDDRISGSADRLTVTERRIAEVIASEPQTIAFGTVAQVAKRAGTSGPSVVRLAVKLGYAGFVELQADVQREVAQRLGPARDRIRQPPPTDLLGLVAAAEQENLSRTLGMVPPELFATVVDGLADRAVPVWVLTGDVTAPVGAALAGPLVQLRPGVTVLGGSEVTASRMLAGLAPGDRMVAVDIRRYERSLAALCRLAVSNGAELVALTDSPLSPLAAMASHTLLISAEGVGPFDSMVGGVALANALVAGVAARLRDSAATRLDAVETAWTAVSALVGEPGSSSLPHAAPARRLRHERPGRDGRSARQATNHDGGQGEALGHRSVAPPATGRLEVFE